MNHHLGCSHKADSPFHILYLVQFSTADQRTTEDLHTGGAPGNITFHRQMNTNPAVKQVR